MGPGGIKVEKGPQKFGKKKRVPGASFIGGGGGNWGPNWGGPHNTLFAPPWGGKSPRPHTGEKKNFAYWEALGGGEGVFF